MLDQEKLVQLVLAENDRRWKEIEAKKETKKATKTIIGNAVLGGIVAGPAGAIVGAIVGNKKTEK